MDTPEREGDDSDYERMQGIENNLNRIYGQCNLSINSNLGFNANPVEVTILNPSMRNDELNCSDPESDGNYEDYSEEE